MQKQLLIEQEAQSLQGSINFAENAVKYFNDGDTILYYGNLGSGKTFLTREFVRLLGSENEVSSPSFSLINRYQGSTVINHIDLYRIHDESELKNLGLEDIFFSDEINFIEWPELIEAKIRWVHFQIEIKTKPENSNWRKFKLFQIHE